MMSPRHLPASDDRLRQFFSAKAMRTRGVVRQRRDDIGSQVGLPPPEVRRRGFRVMEVGERIVVICCSAPVRVLV